MQPTHEPLATSHLIVYVADTDRTIDFWCKGLGGVLEQDEEIAAPALDAIFGRAGVRIRDTFIRIGGVRLHTIEPLDVRAQVSRSEPQASEDQRVVRAASRRPSEDQKAGSRSEPQASEDHRSGTRRTPRAGGIEGLSFEVPDIESAHAHTAAGGLRPTAIFDFTSTAVPCRMFFLDDPDGIRVEMIEYLR